MATWRVYTPEGGRLDIVAEAIDTEAGNVVFYGDAQDSSRVVAVLTPTALVREFVNDRTDTE